ncbi:MAG: hypothetical protein R3338_14535 [Thermoanaerobaculia bacterium]|nr:hypothetical protein [Thermoanaerobaculia bacterium]
MLRSQEDAEVERLREIRRSCRRELRRAGDHFVEVVRMARNPHPSIASKFFQQPAGFMWKTDDPDVGTQGVLDHAQQRSMKCLLQVVVAFEYP